MRQRFRSEPMIGERHNHAVLGLDHFGRRVEPQPFGMTAKIGNGDEQVERLAIG
ncbi:hypothetical protein D9M73_99730 [compost metagenome]